MLDHLQTRTWLKRELTKLEKRQSTRTYSKNLLLFYRLRFLEDCIDLKIVPQTLQVKPPKNEASQKS